MLLLALLPLLACTPTPEGPAADALLAALGECVPLDGTQPFATDISEENRPTGQSVDLCGVDGAIWWRADLDVDCDGGQDEACKADATYAPETAATTADGAPLDASVVPYVVVPLPWTGFAERDADFFYCDRGLTLGGPVAVVYGDVVVYGVIGDEGPVVTPSTSAETTCAGVPDSGGVVGEASYAMAEALGIDPDPNTGGLACDGDCPVTYILFPAPAVDPVEDPDAAVIAGVPLALALTGE